ncbi:ATP-dependent metallopeptidase FtsH/Yme1/Tma family protein [Leptolyngbya sp. FACHB-36]|uniref:ATP-dependent zinc metalloprotease FtsH n=1 Tax=Leptolyngbya sp. FACHB-36 TaxID=2692808 RepID=UPI001680D630|nr:ATP-dependent zinc metalloprotease FtsH [Leptolyngbya sp. FACHB-36]MBD2021663.1 ATP-dependent metallopeptidase FtsH/Yme1/Tma family protein [Leptolyngbya sp. FACHB-36]
MPVDTNNKRLKTPRPRQFGGGLLILFTLLLLLNFVVPSFGSRLPQIAYSDFVAQVQAGKVERAIVGGDRIEFTLKPDPNTPTVDGQRSQVFETMPVALDLDLPKILRENRVEFGAPPPNNSGWIGTLLSWVVPPLIFFGIWRFLLSRGGGGPAALTVGKSKARIYSEGTTGVKFNDVAGVDEAKAELQEIVDFLKNAEKYTNLGAKIPKGVLLVGPPGTGKTMLAKAIAGEAGVPFFSISGSEFIELFVGVGASRVRDLFQQATQQAPCIVFIDELDALGKSRSQGGMFGGNDEREQTLNQLLTEMDGFDANTGVILLAATNRPEVLDPALRRPGRFDRQVVVDRPDKIGREAILNVHARTVKLSEDVDLATIAVRTPGFAGADLANLVNEAALLAARNNRQAVLMADFNEAIERVIAGLEKRSRVLNEQEKKRVAYHEVGHAIVGALMPGAGKVEKISIVPRGVGALGYTLQLPEEDRFLMAEDEIRGRIATLLGGRSAEELIFNNIVSTGASDDIQKATDLAERTVTLYGMSDYLGPVAFEKPQQQFLDGYSSPRRAVSPKVTEEIDREVKDIVDRAHHMALAILNQNRDLLETTAQELLTKEVLEGDTLRAKLNQAIVPDEMTSWLMTGNLPEGTSLMQATLA